MGDVLHDVGFCDPSSSLVASSDQQAFGVASDYSRALHLCNHRCVAAEAVELELSATLLPCRAVQAHSVPGSGLVIPTECSMFLPLVSHALLLKARLAFVVRW